MKRKAPQRKSTLPDEGASLRRRAESRLAKRRGRAAPGRTRLESGRLVHELEVHEIELSMQNAALRETRDELEAALARYTDLYDFAPAGYFSIDEKGLILEANLTGATKLGAARSHLLGRQLRRYLVQESLPAFAEFLERVFARPEKQSCEMPIRSDAGVVFWADIHATAATSVRGERRWCRVVISDITALKRADAAQGRLEELAVRNRELNREIDRRHKVELALRESDGEKARLLDRSVVLQEQLRRLSRGILHAQEAERKRISRELHDVVGQAAVGINLHLEMVSRESAGKSKVRRNRIAQTRRLLATLVDVVHQFSRELRPAALDDLGLVPALKSYTNEFSRTTGIDVALTSVASAERLTNDQSTVLYRVAQEALTNVAKHARATRVELSIGERHGLVSMDIADDGTAFEVDRALSPALRGCLGLIGMRERVEMVGGSFSIDSAPGKGTCISVRVPLADDGVPVVLEAASAPQPRRIARPARAKRRRASG